MTSLLGRMVRLFPGSVPRENLFTEAIAGLFETNSRLCLEWLESEGLLSTRRPESLERGKVSILTQKWLSSTEERVGAGKIDLQIEVHWSPPSNPGGRRGERYSEGMASTDVILIESKIGSKEGDEQLRRFAGHLAARRDSGIKTLVYITRSPEPKELDEVLQGAEKSNVIFRQLRWLHEHEVAAVASDTWGVEVRPNETYQPWHWVAIPNMGLSVGEMFYLEELAEGCAGDGSYEFFFIAPPCLHRAAPVPLSTQ